MIMSDIESKEFDLRLKAMQVEAERDLLAEYLEEVISQRDDMAEQLGLKAEWTAEDA